MSNDAYTVALKNGLDEIRNVCPNINIFVFKDDGEIVVEDEKASPLALSEARDAYLALVGRANVLGGIESMTVQGSEARVNIARFDNFYVTYVCSSEADEKTAANLTRVIVPTTLKLVKQMPVSQPIQVEPTATIPEPHPKILPGTEFEPEISLPKPEAVEFTVEGVNILGGLQTNSDIVQVDSGLVAQWIETYGERNLAKVKVESPVSGKKIVSKFTPFKDSKYDNKGVVQLSKRIQDVLLVHKGGKVLLTPIIEPPEESEEGAEAQIEEPQEEAKRTEKPSKSAEEQTSMPAFTMSGPNSQFIVENLSGISNLVRNPDFIRVDPAVIGQWNELFGDKEIKQVIIEETVSGKRISCKVQPIKNSDLEGKGVVLMTDKMQQALEVKKGSLVLVKPVVE